MNPAAAELLRLLGPGRGDAPASRPRIAALALAARNAAAAPGPLLRSAAAPEPHSPGAGGAFASIEDYAASLAARTVCVTFLAGAGSRWAASLAAALERGDPAAAGADPRAPRCLFPVRDFLGASRRPDGRIAIGAYAVAATAGLGRRLLVVRGWEDEIDSELLAPLGVGPAERRFRAQAAPFGAPLGHGDAAWQVRGELGGADYVIANFGGDASSRLTALSALLALDALDASGAEIDLLLPAALFPQPAYPIHFDEAGLPRSFGHARLAGGGAPGSSLGFSGSAGGRGAAPGAASAAAAGGAPGYANVGLRLYRATALVEALESIHDRFWVEGEGYAIPGNGPSVRDFALDNVDAELAAAGRARILACARPEELTPVKSLDDIGAFEAAMGKVAARDRGEAPA